MSKWWNSWSDDMAQRELYEDFIHEFPSTLKDSCLDDKHLHHLPEAKRQYFALELLACHDKNIRIEALNKLPWLPDALPFQVPEKQRKNAWKFIFEHSVCAFALAPVVKKGMAELRLFYAIYANHEFPPFFPESDNKKHPSIQRELDILNKIPYSKIDQARLRIFSFPPETKTRGNSASLAVASAVWAACRDGMNNEHAISRRLAKGYVISAELTRDNTVKPVAFIVAKADCIGKRKFIVANGQQDIAGIEHYTVSVFDDLKKRLLPEAVYQSELTSEPPRCKLLIGFVSEKIEQFVQIAALVTVTGSICLLYSDDDKSKLPMEKLRKILEENKTAWNGRNVTITTAKIDDKRLDFIETDILRILDESGLKEDEIIFNITGGNKPMTMAGTNAVAGRRIKLIYRDYTNKQYPYMIISYDTSHRLRPAKFMAEPPDLLGNFPAAVRAELCPAKIQK